MNDSISRQQAIDAIDKALDRQTLLNRFVRKVAVDAIKQLPPAQPEIIYCKDCKYRNPFIKDTATMWLPCMAIDTDDKWFCGYGE